MVRHLPQLNETYPEYESQSFSPSGCNPNARCGNGLEKIYPTCAVRYGHMNYIGEFKYAPDMLFNCGAKVVIQTNRGIEIGQQVSLTCSGCDKSIDREKMIAYAKNSDAQELYQLKSGRILRAATSQDLLEHEHIQRDSREKLVRARQLARSLGLDMKIVACEHLFGGERIIFHFMAENRIDFREMVRELAHEYHTRIEMHQVGARDEARLVADYEICGRECCCKNFLKKLRPVSMKMAKLQKATLDPSKVSARCGRLRCCLRYEHEGYDELNKKLPRAGNRVRTERGEGTVRDRQVLTQLLLIEYDDGGVIETVPIEELLDRDLPKQPRPAPSESGDAVAGNDRSASTRPRRRRRREEEHTAETPDADSSDDASAASAEVENAGESEQAQEDAAQADQRPRRRRSRGRRGRSRGRRPQDDGGSESNAGSSDSAAGESRQSNGGEEGGGEGRPRSRRGRRGRRSRRPRGDRPGGDKDGGHENRDES